MLRPLFRLLARIDHWLMTRPRAVRVAAIAVTLATMVATSLPNVPRQFVDFAGLPLIGGVQRYETSGPDSVGDMYTARAVLNDVSDMYTKARTEQTPTEAATWSKEASAPYPPAALLAEAGLLAIGQQLGVGFYGMILACAVLFVGLSLVYFVGTRWYLFPLLYLNFDYFSGRFVYVQDNTYLIMLVVVMAALFLARGGGSACHTAMAIATTIKLSPLYYTKNILRMPRPSAMLHVAILVVGLVLPYFVWENYLYIYRFGNELKGDLASTVGALLLAVPFALVLWYIEVKVGFDKEDLVGWGLVPFAMFLGFKMNVARHLLIVLLVPDKRAVRNVAAAIGLAVPALLPGFVLFNSSLVIATLVLIVGLAGYLQEIGWDTVRDDARHPLRTMRMLVSPERLAGGRPDAG
ncbi:MAG: hypothetical protein IT183_04560 [Acidobacteria bacterium]|nr:hypothetical protein [Acidobacteriota bacterium]